MSEAHVLSLQNCVWDLLFLIPSRAFYFFSTKTMASLTLKHHNSFENKNNRKATYIFALRPLVEEFLKFNDICELELPKT